MFEHEKTLAKSESAAPKLRASELTIGTFAAHVLPDVGVLEKVQDANDEESYWFVPSNGTKKLLFDASKTGGLKPMSALARHLGDAGILPRISTHPQAEDYMSGEWWFDYANRHGTAPDTLRQMSEALLKAADLRGRKALEDAAKAAGGMEKLKQLLAMS